MSDIEVIYTPRAPKFGPYSQAIRVGGTVYLAGQIGASAETKQLVSSDVEAQTIQALENMRYIMEAAGGELSHIVQATVFLWTDMHDREAINRVWEKYFPNDTLRPTRAMVAAAQLPLFARVEIAAIAEIPSAMQTHECVCGH